MSCIGAARRREGQLCVPGSWTEWRRAARLALGAALVLLVAAPVMAQAPKRPLAQRVTPELQKFIYPNADKLGPEEGKPPAMAAFKEGKIVGYVFSTLDVVNMPGYSSTPFDVIAGVNVDGTVTGAKVIYHNEPHVINDSIRQPKLDRFLTNHVGYKLRGNNAGMLPPDFVAGATVTARSMRTAVIDSARFVMRSRGLGPVVKAPTLDVEGFSPLTFDQLVAMGSLRHRWLTNEEMGAQFVALGGANAEPEGGQGVAPSDIYTHVFVGLATPETIGRNLFGQRSFEAYAKRMTQGGHIFFIGASGRFDINGSAYQQRAKGYLFDRIQVVQGDKVYKFDRDHYQRLAVGSGEGVRAMQAAGLFYLDNGSGFEPLKPWRLEVLVPGTKASGEPITLTLPLDYLIPDYHVLVPDQPAEPSWYGAWRDSATDLYILGAMLVVLTAILALQAPLAKRRSLHRWVRSGFLMFVLVWLGWIAGGQLTVVNIMNYLQAPFGQINFGFYMAEPLIVVIAAYTLVSLVLLGRGVFCGWLCPFGALQELLGQLARAIGLPQWQPTEKLQARLWWGKYVSAAIVLGLGFYSMETAETAAEVEPFKTAITSGFTRAWPYVVYAVALLSIGLFSERAYCRFLCPLGGALAVVGKLHLFDLLRRRDQCGTPCRLCERACPVKAIAGNGSINMTECFQCLDCQVEYYDDRRCPPLARARKLKARLTPPNTAAPLPAAARKPVTA